LLSFPSRAKSTALERSFLMRVVTPYAEAWMSCSSSAEMVWMESPLARLIV
jgi:hypothetical protein